MTSLVNKLDSMTLNDNTSRKDLFGYICRVKKAKAHYLCEGEFIVIPGFNGKKYIFAALSNATTTEYLPSSASTEPQHKLVLILFSPAPVHRLFYIFIYKLIIIESK